MSENFQKLKERVARIARLGEVAALVSWDQNTYMPSGAANARAEQSSTLGQFIHELFTSDETANLLSKSEADTEGMDPDSNRARQDREREGLSLALRPLGSSVRPWRRP